ncbi:MAG: cell division protein FtsW [Actinobacteria bacterium]|nr:cell division protein FtsW [Actinomycetota bacterium]
MGSARRNTEFGLLLLVVIVTAAAYVLASLGVDANIPANILPFLLVLLAMLLASNLVTRKWAPEADPMLLPLAALLNGLGYVMVSRLRPDLAGQQALWTAIGLGAFIATLVVVPRARDLARYRYTAMLAGIALLALPIIPGIGREFNGSQIWVSFGPINFQPGEFAKVALAVFFAGYLVDKRELLAMSTRRVGPIMLPEPKHLGPVLVAWAMSLLIMVYETDLGSSLLFFSLFIVMLWVATERLSYLLVGTTLFAAGAYFSWRVFAHVQRRVSVWLDPFADPYNSGFQILQSAFAFADGGLFGRGLGSTGNIRFFAKESDFIFVFIGQELGLLGATVVIIAYICIVGAGLRIAVRAENTFDKLLTVGLTTLIGLQAFIIMAGVTRLLPLTGVTLPFVSYGGSSLISNYITIALLLRVSDESARSRAAVGTQPMGARS